MKKNRIITPLLITLTGLFVAAGCFQFFRQPQLVNKADDLTNPIHQPSFKRTKKLGTEKSETTNAPQQIEKFCTRKSFENKSYIVCQVNPEVNDISLFLDDPNGEPFKYFRRVEKFLRKKGQKLAFAVNGGMFHKDYSAVGLYIENGKIGHAISTKEGPGNFHMKPNGVFFITNKKAGVLDTEHYIKSAIKPELATQSGPMLVIENKIHPRFIPNSPYLEYRNGVGVREDGTVFFVNSDERVNFDEFARFFRDDLKTPNALFLDGSISSLYAPELNRYDWWYALGSILAVTIGDKEQNSADNVNNPEHSH